jgi:hypothetical protein
MWSGSPQEFALTWLGAVYCAAWAHHILVWFTWAWWKGIREKGFDGEL